MSDQIIKDWNILGLGYPVEMIKEFDKIGIWIIAHLYRNRIVERRHLLTFWSYSVGKRGGSSHSAYLWRGKW